ncbi:C39 family peptidase [Streptomyces silvensis]|uniref:Peptidase n=1 Tax=Streptomyces silvensis TaxID=1765722 RepID=A0A0W7X0T1_9ACTN|nr:C39 family peptidase [Streptomyces silvensis]KUF16427.1 peptidase [Streptomyces silvensis]
MTPCTTCHAPSLTQFASPDLVGRIVYEGHDPADDPAWRESGAATLEDYARWCSHLCGLTCLRMALGPSAPSLFELRDGALKYGAYTEDAEGTIRGLIYAPFAEYVREVHAVDATVHRHLTVEEIAELLDAGRTVIASVHFEIRRPERPAPGRGGHLILLTGRTADGALHLHNPSGIDARSRTADLSPAAFEPFFAGRGVSMAVGGAPGTR